MVVKTAVKSLLGSGDVSPFHPLPLIILDHRLVTVIVTTGIVPRLE